MIRIYQKERVNIKYKGNFAECYKMKFNKRKDLKYNPFLDTGLENEIKLTFINSTLKKVSRFLKR